MNTTSNSTGKFILSVRLDGNVSFGVLSAGQDQQYDEASREKRHRRPAVLELVKERSAGWQRNYKPYANASFRIEEVDADGVVTLISGPAYERDADVKADVRARLVKVAGSYNRTAKNASQKNMGNWLFDLADCVLGETAADSDRLLPFWARLPLAERIIMVDEIVAGFYTPAVVS